MTAETILIIDDDRLILSTLSKGLQQAGYEVMEANSGAEAAAVCEQNNRPDLALVDMHMPGMSGVETAKHLKENWNVPFLIFSAYDDTELVADSIELGALGYLVKPMDVRQIIPAVKSALSRAKEISGLRKTEHNLNIALNSDRNTSTAVGLIMERYRLDRDSAFDALRRFARSQRRKIAEVSGELVQSADALNSVMPK